MLVIAGEDPGDAIDIVAFELCHLNPSYGFSCLSTAQVSTSAAVTLNYPDATFITLFVILKRAKIGYRVTISYSIYMQGFT